MSDTEIPSKEGEHLSVVVSKGSAVQELQGCLDAKHGLLAELVVAGRVPLSALSLGLHLALCPCKHLIARLRST